MDNPHLRKNHEAMREVALRARIPCVDLDAYLKEPNCLQSGLLWWDLVHPTSQGHKLAGEFLARSITRAAGW